MKLTDIGLILLAFRGYGSVRFSDVRTIGFGIGFSDIGGLIMYQSTSIQTYSSVSIGTMAVMP